MKIVVIGGSGLIGSKVVACLREGGLIEVAGPEELRFDDLLRQRLAADGDPRTVVADPKARYFGAELQQRTLVAGDSARLGKTRFEDWLGQPAAA